MTWPERTRYFLLALVVVTLVWDLVAVHACGPAASVSWVARDFCEKHPIVACLAGVVIGHILWNE
jgi:hypothetical protein